MGKAKDVTAEVFTDYSRILLEFRANRLPEHLIEQMDEKVVGKLRRRADATTSRRRRRRTAGSTASWPPSPSRRPGGGVRRPSRRSRSCSNKLRDIRGRDRPGARPEEDDLADRGDHQAEAG